MARRPQEETQFGSDSFLDIVANIVGILIILIVVAGVRLSRAPLLSIEPVRNEEPAERLISLWSNTPDDDDEPVLASVYVAPPPIVHEETVPIEPFIAPSEAAFPPVPEVAIAEDLKQTFATLQEQSQQLGRQIEETEAQKAELSKSALSEKQAAEAFVEKLNALAAELTSQQQQVALIAEENERSQALVNELHERLAEVEAQQPETNTLAHRLNPVGRVVKGNEVHFRLSNGRISYVPIDQLVELVKKQVDRRKDILLKQSRFQASVGPVDGYMMEFLVQRESGGLFDTARYGAGVYRFGVTDWEIRPTTSVRDESLEEALESRSQFRRAILSQGTTATITFWVYPDSFELHKELKEFLQTSGLWVASRPLPVGVPIAGSPNGSSSVAQ